MPKILIVEDDFDIQELLENFLQENAYETATANDGIEAITLFNNRFILSCISIFYLLKRILTVKILLKQDKSINNG